MNNRFIYTLIFILSISFSNINAQNRDYTSDTLSMGSFYTNDIFYSMSEGEVANIPRAGWDIAFYTSKFSAGIIINEGNNVELFAYPNGDIDSWASIDTTGMSTWNKLSNNPNSWEDGAFNRNATGHPDYGWCIYNSITHSLTGDSLFLIVSPEAGLKKLWIVKKVSVDNIYHIKYADIDGSNEQTVEIDVNPYVDKNFIYFSLNTNEVIDREPSEDWDLLFTKYTDKTMDNSGNMVDYLVTGATSNINRYANKFYPVADDFVDWSSSPFDSLKNVVGYNWKAFSMATYEWTVEDSTTFFIMNQAGDVYKLVFTFWEGMSTGVFGLNKELIQLSAVEDNIEDSHSFTVYPNPATNVVNIAINNETAFNGNILITDMSGRLIYSSDIGNSVSNAPFSVNISNFVKGLYFITLQGNGVKETRKLIVR